MPTKNPRLNVVLDAGLHATLKRLARSEQISLSLKARDLIREALEMHEDRYWADAAETREKTSRTRKLLSHDRVWET